MSGTERPWHVDGVFIVNDGDLIVATMGIGPRSGADSDLILRAVNAFDDLVAALRPFAALPCKYGSHGRTCFTMDMGALSGKLSNCDPCEARAAIAKAEGKLPW